MPNFWCSDCGKVYVSVAGERCRPCQKKIENAQGDKAEVAVVTACVSAQPKAILQMFLDANRDGTIDAVPTDYEQWQWGEEGAGAIIMVKTRQYADDADVDERSEIQFKWEADKEKPQQWQANLEVDFEDRVKFYPSARDDAAALEFENKTINLKDLQFDDQGRIRLWMEAANFGADAQEASWRVSLTFTFTARGGIQERQYAQLRIAPWIMASDLDPTDYVFARQNELVDEGLPIDNRIHESNEYALRYNATAGVIADFVGDGFNAFRPKSTASRKGFARDVMKSGYSTSPHCSEPVILKCLDLDSPLDSTLPKQAAQVSNAGYITDIPLNVPRAQHTAQDNGGNLMVSPPTDEYPWGRILYGHDADNLCHFRSFFEAQKLQMPLALDSTWLSVGHVDEILSFARAQNGQFKALLMSPRLGYIMLAATARRSLDNSVVSTIDWAVGKNNNCIEAGAYSRDTLIGQIGEDPNAPIPEAPTTLHSVDAYVENPPAPALERAVIFRTASVGLADVFNGANLDDVFPPRVGRLCYEIRTHVSHYLLKVNDFMLQMTDTYQPKIDTIRQVLENQLGFNRNDIIDIPVLLNYSGDGAVALTGDSVNMLVKAGEPASQCLIPKPFGPVFKSAYLFEQYIHNQLETLGIVHRFAVDDGYHVNEGEIHCGTNQVHPALEGNKSKWWLHEPPQ